MLAQCRTEGWNPGPSLNITVLRRGCGPSRATASPPSTDSPTASGAAAAMASLSRSSPSASLPDLWAPRHGRGRPQPECWSQPKRSWSRPPKLDRETGRIQTEPPEALSKPARAWSNRLKLGQTRHASVKLNLVEVEPANEEEKERRREAQIKEEEASRDSDNRKTSGERKLKRTTKPANHRLCNRRK